jgi:hypothetical protein
VVFSEESYVAGTVFVDADIAQTLETGAYEFVALSRTTSEEDLGYREHARYFDYTRYSLCKYCLCPMPFWYSVTHRVHSFAVIVF